MADTRSTVLIVGESGTGKSLIARAIHDFSDRRTLPFVIAGADERDSIMALTILFVAGGYLLWRVDVEAGAKAAEEMDGERARAEDLAPRVGFLVVDECHRCPSRTFTEAVTAFDCRYMLGLSATPWRRASCTSELGE